jgi:hypothetical protein
MRKEMQEMPKQIQFALMVGLAACAWITFAGGLRPWFAHEYAAILKQCTDRSHMSHAG